MIIIEMNSADAQYARKIKENCEQNTGIITQQSFSGVSDVLQIGIVLTEFALPFVAGVVTEMIRQRKKIKIKVGDVEIEGLGEKNALEKLEQLLERKSTDKEV